MWKGTGKGAGKGRARLPFSVFSSEKEKDGDVIGTFQDLSVCPSQQRQEYRSLRPGPRNLFVVSASN